ncbi:MAG TPA: mechanosensitive ion channel family protein [Acidimicrobiales bacterium]|nr:mechanosensitive ion channel family protein [Acidimicrobiales bacterium]
MPELDELGARAAELGVRFAVVAGVVVVAVALSRLTAPVVRWLVSRRGRPSRTRVFTALYRVVVVVFGSLAALTLAFPSVRVADVLGIFGILSVAAGFAFKDTFENLLAGVLLLLRDPFKSGDQVVLSELDGTIEGVTVRETLVRGHDGRLFHIPNAEVMRGVIAVETDAPLRRQAIGLRLPADTDLSRAREVLGAALERTTGVEALPPPQVVLTDIVDGDVEIECRFWTGSRRSRATGTRDAALESVLGALREARIGLPVDSVRLDLDGMDGGRSEARRPR